MQLLTAAALSLFLAANGLAQTTGDPRFNPANGQSTQVWRKAMPIDYSHIRAELDIPDINVVALTGVSTLTGEVTGLPVTRIVLDAAGPQPPVPTAATGSSVLATGSIRPTSWLVVVLVLLFGAFAMSSGGLEGATSAAAARVGISPPAAPPPTAVRAAGKITRLARCRVG